MSDSRTVGARRIPIIASPVAASEAAPEALVEERTWSVAGLHCAACADTLRQTLQELPGVQAVRVGYAAGIAVVRAPAGVQAELPAEVQGGGYRLAPLDGVQDQQLRQAEARQLLWRWFVAGFCMMQVMMLAAPTYFEDAQAIPPDLLHLLHWGAWVLSIPVVWWSAQPFWRGAWRSLRLRQIGMDVPVALGIGATFVVSSLALFEPSGPWGRTVYFDSLTMFVAFLLTGRWFELKVRHAAAAELAGLVAQAPTLVQRERADGLGVDGVAAEAVQAGDVLRVPAGEVIPVDGVLLDAEAEVDEALLTGESEPVHKAVGAALVGGSLSRSQALRMRALAPRSAGRAAELARRYQAALTERPQADTLSDRGARWFLVGVLVLAALAGAVWWVMAPARAFGVVCAVLIVTCPCAFALAQPAARVASHRALARRGVLLQRLSALDALAGVTQVWLDKTGTLTQAQAQPQALSPDGMQALPAAVVLASWSRHPVAQAIARSPVALATAGQGAAVRWHSVQETPGQGLRAQDAEGRWWQLGRAADGRTVFGPEAGVPVLAFALQDAPRPEAAGLVQRLRAQGLTVRLLSGDRADRVLALGQALGLAPEAVRGGCLPEDKLAGVQQAQQLGERVLMVGDGVNDAPVLAQADASVATLGATGMATQAADAVLLRGDLSVLPALLQQGRRTLAITRQNLVWAAGYNGVAVPLAALGYLPPWAAGLGMALSSLAVVGNAMRLMR